MFAARRLSLLTVVLLGLTACGTTHRQVAAVRPVLDPNIVIDPSDAVFRTSIQHYLAATHQAPNSQYEYVRRDLDGDGRRDALVMFETPFYSWCNDQGCKMLVMKAANNGFTPIAEISPVRGPVLISDTRTDGWHDLVLRISGRHNMASKDVALKFDGRTYPSEPEWQPALPGVLALANINGTQIFP